MSDSSLSPSSLLILLRLKWRGNSQQESQTLSNILDEYGSHPTLGHLDTMEELDSTSTTVKTLKGILKGPNNSLVLRTSQSTRNNQQFTEWFKQNRQEMPLIYDNLNESKSKKVTFSAETKNTEAKRNLRYIRLKKKAVQNNSDSDNLKVEGTPATNNNLTPQTETAADKSPRNMFKITKKTSDPVKSPRCLFNLNFTPKQSNDLNDLEDSQKDIFKVPRFGKSLSSETPTQSYSSLQTMLEESPIYPSTDSSETTNYLSQIGSFSARDTTLRTPWNAYFHDIRNSGSLTSRDDQVMLEAKREKNLDYYAELQKKAPLILQNVPSSSDSKAKPLSISKNGTRSDTFVIKKRDFIRPVVNDHERP